MLDRWPSIHLLLAEVFKDQHAVLAATSFCHLALQCPPSPNALGINLEAIIQPHIRRFHFHFILRWHHVKIWFFQKCIWCIVTSGNKEISIIFRQTVIYERNCTNLIVWFKCAERKSIVNRPENDVDAIKYIQSNYRIYSPFRQTRFHRFRRLVQPVEGATRVKITLCRLKLHQWGLILY